jgi:hypothetical protein
MGLASEIVAAGPLAGQERPGAVAGQEPGAARAGLVVVAELSAWLAEMPLP